MRTAHLLVLALLAAAGCAESTRFMAGDVGVHSDEPGDPEYDTCFLDGVDGLDPLEYSIQLDNPECDTTICLHYGAETFCTIRCDRDSQCRDIGAGACSFEIDFGGDEFLGHYCVPRAVDPNR